MQLWNGQHFNFVYRDIKPMQSLTNKRIYNRNDTVTMMRLMRISINASDKKTALIYERGGKYIVNEEKLKDNK